MKVLITGPWIPRQHYYGAIIEQGDRWGTVSVQIVIGQFKGQVVSVPNNWWNRLAIWMFEIRYDEP